MRHAFHVNPGPEVIRIGDRKAKDVRINALIKEYNNNARYYGEKVIMKVGQIASMPIRE